MTLRKDQQSTSVVGYVRVSTEEQGRSGLGLSAQRATIRAAAERQGWQVTFAGDVASGGSRAKRPGLAEALDACRDGEARALVVSKLDRLTRSLLDFADLVQRAQREGWALVVLDQGFDLGTPHGRAMAGMLAVFAQYERELIGSRIKDAYAVKRQRGDRGLIPTDARRLILDLRAAGLTLRAIVAELNRRRVPAVGKRWHLQTVARVVREAHATA